MSHWKRLDKVWCYWPTRPIGLIEVIGGSYLAISPQISYRRLLEGLGMQSLAIHAWSYLPGFDHQAQANQAWKSMRECKRHLEHRIGEKLHVVRLGHSLGCKLHLLAPDGGRNSKGMIALSFNNFAADRSIPMLAELAPKFNFKSEFSPSPQETLRLINERYNQSNNLLITFNKDSLDQSEVLLKCLEQRRSLDNSQRLHLDGDHLTPASAGVRRLILKGLTNDITKSKNLKDLIKIIFKWSLQKL